LSGRNAGRTAGRAGTCRDRRRNHIGCCGSAGRIWGVGTPSIHRRHTDQLCAVHAVTGSVPARLKRLKVAGIVGGTGHDRVVALGRRCPIHVLCYHGYSNALSSRWAPCQVSRRPGSRRRGARIAGDSGSQVRPDVTGALQHGGKGFYGGAGSNTAPSMESDQSAMSISGTV